VRLAGKCRLTGVPRICGKSVKLCHASLIVTTDRVGAMEALLDGASGCESTRQANCADIICADELVLD
jgi:hypothetical protein